MESFDPKNPEKWIVYLERMIFFFLANDIVKLERRKAIFLTLIGAETYAIARSLASPKELSFVEYDDLIKLLTDHFCPKPNVIVQRYHFNKRNQGTESVSAYVAELRKLSENCEFVDLEDRLRDRLVCGLRKESIVKRLLSESNLTFEKALNFAICDESASAHRRQCFARKDYRMADGLGPNILGRQWFSAFRLKLNFLNSLETSPISPDFEELFKEEIDAYNGPLIHIDIPDNAEPKFVKARTVPFALRELEDKKLKSLEEQGIIEPIKFSKWASPIVTQEEIGVFLEKKNYNNNNMAENAIRPPKQIGLNELNKEGWESWLESFEWYEIATQLSSKAPEVQVAIFMAAMGREAQNIFKSFNLNNADKNNLSIVKDKFNNYFSPKLNTTIERFKFNQMKQKEDESFNDFLTMIKLQIANCKYAVMSDELLKDRIVVGIINNEIRERLLSEADLDLEKATQICIACENATNQMKHVLSDSDKQVAVTKMNSKKWEDRKEPRKENITNQSHKIIENCRNCGRSHKINQCPAYQKRCNKCKKLNHFANLCRSQNTNSYKVRQIVGSPEPEMIQEFVIQSVENTNLTEDWYEEVKIKGKKVNMKLDTGAQCNVLPLSLAGRLNLEIQRSPVKSLISFSGHRIPVEGQSLAMCMVKNMTAYIRFIISSDNTCPILGRQTCSNLGLVKRVNTCQTITQEYQELFEGIGCLKGYEYEAKFQTSDMNMQVRPPRPIPLSIKESVKKELEEMEDNGIIKKVNYPTPISSQMVIAKQKGKIRICIDPSDINKVILRSHFPLRTFDQIAVNLHGSKYFTKLDLKKGYWQIKVAPNSQRYFTFSTPWGRYTLRDIENGTPRNSGQKIMQISGNAGATRVTSARVDRRILRQAVAAPQATCTAILQHVQDTLDHSISTRTISRRLVANGLHSCRPLRRLPLTPPNRRQRLEWCRARSTWMTEWHRVVFSDESRFCLSSDSRRVRVWRRRGERSNPAAIVERPTVRQRGIMVWGAIAYDSRSPLLRIQGTMTAQRYVDDVLRPVTLPYLQGVPNALYHQENARPHTARISQQALQDVQMFPWPPYSPDLSPIEHVWDIIGRRLHALPQPRSEDELWQMVEREWRAIPQDAIRTLIDSLPRRVAACIAVRDLLQDLEGTENSIYDILIHAPDPQTLEIRTRAVLQRLKENGIKLNKDKCKFQLQEVQFLGHIVTTEGIKIDPEKVRAIGEIKSPSNKQELQRLLGMIQYLSRFIPNLAEKTKNMRLLLKKDTPWLWDESLDCDLLEIKTLLRTAPTLKFFNPNGNLTLSVDASSYALGAVLLQNGRPIAYASSALNSTQQNYAQIEKEALAIKFGCDKFHQLIYGKTVDVETDHRPLETIFKKPLSKAPPRLQRIFLQIQQYDLRIKYKKGKELLTADLLSRDCSYEDTYLEENFEVLMTTPTNKSSYEELQALTKEDQELKNLILYGWPNYKSAVPESCKKYWPYRDELSTNEDLIFKGSRVFIPLKWKTKILRLIHEGHQGTNSCLRRARDSTYWHGMSQDIINTVENCRTCQANQRNKTKEPMIIKEIPNLPWEIVAADIFSIKGKNYLLITDNYSGFIDFKEMKTMNSAETIESLKKWFRVHGIPRLLETDNGPNFMSRDFKDFQKKWLFDHQTSSPLYPKSNGLAERAVQTAKNLIWKCLDSGQEVELALLNFYNTPRDGLPSPAQCLFSRRTRTLLPTSTHQLEPEIQKGHTQNLRNKREKQKTHHDKTAKTTRSFKEGEKIMLKQHHREWIPARVTQEVAPRSYKVQTPTGEYRRNSSFMRHTNLESPKQQRRRIPEIPKSTLPEGPGPNGDKEQAQVPEELNTSTRPFSGQEPRSDHQNAEHKNGPLPITTRSSGSSSHPNDLKNEFLQRGICNGSWHAYI
ncbi:K02A2.6-like, partial [Cordylochernes scorpioides]